MKKSWIVILIILAVLIVDQVLKIYIKTNIPYAGGFDILGLSWAKIHFVENEGMAFGLSFGGSTGKLMLSLFRIIMVSFLGYLLVKLIQAGESLSLLISFALIIAGAIGNILDSAFYGLIFSESTFHGGLAEFMPEGGGYAPILHGRVVDMLYFPLIDTTFPEWLPNRPDVQPGWVPNLIFDNIPWAGERFRFFKPVFNIADSAISVGVASILLFNRKFFAKEEAKKKEKPENAAEEIQPTDNTVDLLDS